MSGKQNSELLTKLMEKFDSIDRKGETKSHKLYLFSLLQSTIFLEDCKNGHYFQTTDRCYVQFQSVEVTWDVASDRCKKTGGVLAAIPNQETQNFIENNFDFSSAVGSGFWLGGVKKSGFWTWVDGSTWTGYTNWLSGQPNDEEVLLIGPDYTWRDWTKSNVLYYLCQY